MTVVIALVDVNHVLVLPRASLKPGGGRDGLDHRFEALSVVHIARQDFPLQRQSASIDREVALDAPFAPVRRVWPRLWPPPGAGMLAASTGTREKSISSCVRNSASSTSWSRSQTPACCQSHNRRQQVIPLPQRRTKRMPVSAVRSGSRGRPPLGLSRSVGNSGATFSQSASGNIGLAILTSYSASPGGALDRTQPVC